MVNLHVWTELIEVPVAIFLHFVWRVDGQGPVWVHGDHHTPNVCLKGDKKQFIHNSMWYFH